MERRSRHALSDAGGMNLRKPPAFKRRELGDLLPDADLVCNLSVVPGFFVHKILKFDGS
jgi:hypothetical protein